jgi:hypothetical protein
MKANVEATLKNESRFLQSPPKCGFLITGKCPCGIVPGNVAHDKN